ncbi:hypothetical protein BDZ45DRAFT_750023 [Acephala macrosclerotiorum]|nr:hypothetical protein BDZ45DRAFT_750023 [Acephala macrosclerotiorum]
MASGQHCSFPTDYAAYTGFWAQVNNSTNSIYSNLCLNFPSTAPGVAQPTATREASFASIGASNQGCNRQTDLIQIINNHEYGAQIIPNAAGLAAVTTLKDSGFTSNYFWLNLTSAFYVNEKKSPLGLWIPNARSYHACTGGLGDVSVYFRPNTTTAPAGCQDNVLDIELGNGR